MVKGRSDGEETKRRIVGMAKQLFMGKGYSAVTMNEVCEAAAVSKGSLYHHFLSKDELFLYVLEDDAQQWKRKWESIRVTHKGIEDQLYLLADQYADDFQNPLSKALEEFARSRVISQEILERILLINEMNLQACRDVVQEGMERGEFIPGDVEQRVIIVSSMLEGLGKLYYTADQGKEQSEVRGVYREAVRLLLGGMRAAQK
ncbi:TetR family transcriptional regulator [Paenibacillaceae bacterium]|nr:TetR family transcriptional regulator [Paenibacillaceae bacterium]